jgi:hypothetical protein
MWFIYEFAFLEVLDYKMVTHAAVINRNILLVNFIVGVSKNCCSMKLGLHNVHMMFLDTGKVQ